MKNESHLSIPLPSIDSGLSTIFERCTSQTHYRYSTRAALQQSTNIFGKVPSDAGTSERHRRSQFHWWSPGLIETRRLEEASTVLLHDPKGVSAFVESGGFSPSEPTTTGRGRSSLRWALTPTLYRNNCASCNNSHTFKVTTTMAFCRYSGQPSWRVQIAGEVRV